MHKNQKILIVDDEPKNLKILRIRLEKNYELREAASGAEALEIMGNFEPAVVLLDIMMDGMDGYEVTRKIKENPATRSSKVILVSGKAMIEEKLEGYQAGADDYITKPFNGDELKAKVNVFLSLYNLEMQQRETNASLEREVQARCEQLLKSERLAFIGMHSGEIVHNLKNPLAIIKSYAQMLLIKQPDLRELTRIDHATDRILDILKNILSPMNQTPQQEIEAVSVKEVINGELEFLRIDSQFKNTVEIDLELGDGLQVWASKSHTEQVFGNLIKNAAEAMLDSKKKKLTIRSTDDDGSVLVTIQDTGEGISKENLEKVFEPLFTTKDGRDGKLLGNGLGLPYCKKMVETFNGTLEIQSEKGVGTEIRVRIPAHSEEPVESVA